MCFNEKFTFLIFFWIFLYEWSILIHYKWNSIDQLVQLRWRDQWMTKRMREEMNKQSLPHRNTFDLSINRTKRKYGWCVCSRHEHRGNCSTQKSSSPLGLVAAHSGHVKCGETATETLFTGHEKWDFNSARHLGNCWVPSEKGEIRTCPRRKCGSVIICCIPRWPVTRRGNLRGNVTWSIFFLFYMCFHRSERCRACKDSTMHPFELYN